METLGRGKQTVVVHRWHHGPPIVAAPKLVVPWQTMVSTVFSPESTQRPLLVPECAVSSCPSMGQRNINGPLVGKAFLNCFKRITGNRRFWHAERPRTHARTPHNNPIRHGKPYGRVATPGRARTVAM